MAAAAARPPLPRPGALPPPPALAVTEFNLRPLQNHDFDYGLENMMKLNSQCNFPWLMANVIERGQGGSIGAVGSLRGV